MRYFAAAAILFLARAGGAELPLSKIDAVVEKSRAAWSAPGVAVAIIKDDQVVLLKGYGLKELGKPGAVTPDTLFAIGSTTKAFTTAAMAMLVDEGKMSWDDPVRKHIEFFHLADPLADAAVTLRDLITHRTGLARHDELWASAPWRREELIRRIGFVPLDRPFRSAWQYQNLMFLTAGYAVERAAAMSWDDFIAQRIFTPLGMKTADTTVRVAEKAADHATPHGRIAEGRVVPIRWRNIDNIGPAGSINASARDIAQWIRFQLNGGVVDGKRLISEKNFAEMHTQQMAIRPEDVGRNWNPDAVEMAYGMGWFLGEYRGVRLVNHGGAIDGFRTNITLVPKEHLGLVVMANLGNDNMPESLRWELLDVLLGLPERDWDKELIAHFGKIEAAGRAEVEQLRNGRAKGTRPSLDLGAYAGTFENPGYGEIVISRDGNVLNGAWRGVPAGRLEHLHYDTFLAGGGRTIQFRLDTAGQVIGLATFGTEFKKR